MGNPIECRNARVPCSQGGLKSCPLPANGFARRRGKDFSILLVKRNGGFKCLEFAVGARRTYMPQWGYMFPTWKALFVLKGENNAKLDIV